MTIDVNTLRDRLRELGDAAAAEGVRAHESGRADDAQFHAGRQAAFLTAWHEVGALEEQELAERDESILDVAVREPGLLDRVLAARAGGLPGQWQVHVEALAQEIARYSPRDAIAGWLAGYRANGDATGIAVHERALEISENMRDEAIGGEAARLGLIGHRGEGVDLGAVERLEEFARTAGGSVDMASGEVHSDADAGL